MEHSMSNYPAKELSAFNNTALHDEYRRALTYLRARYSDHTPFLGYRNPYTGQAITTKDEFDEYLRQYALRLAYEKQFSAAQEISVRTAPSERSGKRGGRFFVALIALIALLCIGFFKILTQEKQASYDVGYADGYSSGEISGYSKGTNDGFSSGYDAGKRTVPDNPTSDNRAVPHQTPSTVTVYVSRNGVIHRKSNCSGMKYYTEMSYSAALAAGYRECSKCF